MVKLFLTKLPRSVKMQVQFWTNDSGTTGYPRAKKMKLYSQVTYIQNVPTTKGSLDRNMLWRIQAQFLQHQIWQWFLWYNTKGTENTK